MGMCPLPNVLFIAFDRGTVNTINKYLHNIALSAASSHPPVTRVPPPIVFVIGRGTWFQSGPRYREGGGSQGTATPPPSSSGRPALQGPVPGRKETVGIVFVVVAVVVVAVVGLGCACRSFLLWLWPSSSHTKTVPKITAQFLTAGPTYTYGRLP